MVLGRDILGLAWALCAKGRVASSQGVKMRPVKLDLFQLSLIRRDKRITLPLQSSARSSTSLLPLKMLPMSSFLKSCPRKKLWRNALGLTLEAQVWQGFTINKRDRLCSPTYGVSYSGTQAVFNLPNTLLFSFSCSSIHSNLKTNPFLDGSTDEHNSRSSV